MSSRSPSHRRRGTRQYCHAFALLVIELRDEHDLTQRGLADRIGRPQSYVCKVELEERRVDLDDIAELVGAFGLTLADAIAQLAARFPEGHNGDEH
jgi:transcriptional regulator with XRE-family HTH domain